MSRGKHTMKKIVIRRWDETNGMLIADYIRVSEYQTIARRYKSPILMGSPQNCRGRMHRSGQDIFIGNTFALNLARIIRRSGYAGRNEIV
jgi:hypothetical protein